MKKIILTLGFCFLSLAFVNAQETAVEKEAYALVEKVSKPAFAPAIKQFSSMVKADKLADFLKEVEGTYPELFKSIAKIYAEEFTLEEIKELNRFYDTPLGKKMAEKQGTMAQKGMMAGQSWGMKVQGLVQKYQ